MAIKDDKVRAWRSLLLAQDAVVRAIEYDLDHAGAINLQWYDVLLELNAAPDRRLRMQELAARTVLSRTRVSRLVDELVDRGYIERQPDPDDGRAWFATLTTAGRSAFRSAVPTYLEGIDKHFTSILTADESAVITTALERVIEAHRTTTVARRVRR